MSGHHVVPVRLYLAIFAALMVFTAITVAVAYVDLGPLGLQYILKAGGSGYFRQNAVAPYLRSGRLSLVRGALEFLYPAYAVYPEDADPKIFPPALAGLRHVATRPGGSRRQLRLGGSKS